MKAEPDRKGEGNPSRTPTWGVAAVVLSAAVGLGLMAQEALSSSATYDEVAYLRIAARWWRTGDQEEITRMGSPLTFWKLQQVPVLWALDLSGNGRMVDDPIGHIVSLLPIARLGALWVWLLAFGITVAWSGQLYGPRAMAFAAVLFALSPNLLAHGALVTMEMPLVALSAAVFFAFWRFLEGRRMSALLAAGVLAGVALSCKFTAILFSPILGLVWWVDLWLAGRLGWIRRTAVVALGILGLAFTMLLTDFVMTGFARVPLSATKGVHPSLDGRFGPALSRWIARAVETPIPEDWVGFATQVRHQRSGGSSYLLGERRMHGWWYYYFVALAVKAPLSIGLLVALRTWKSWRRLAGSPSGTWTDRAKKSWMFPLAIAAFLAVTAAGSSRNYGVRYLLPMSPLAVVWLSELAECRGWVRGLAGLALLGQAQAVLSVHPHELTYFNALAGGPVGGRRILSDSNLDWGQGLKSLARLQKSRAEFRDLTLFSFGDLRESAVPSYGVVALCYVVDAGEVHPTLPAAFRPGTKYVAVSASLQWGPWGPSGYFRALEGVRPVALTDDRTIAIYRTSDLHQ